MIKAYTQTRGTARNHVLCSLSHAAISQPKKTKPAAM